MPLIVAGSSVTVKDAICREPVITCDFFPTIAEIAGIRELPESLDGSSIAGLLKDPGEALKRDAIYWHYPHYHPGGAEPHAAVRYRDFKLIEFYENGSLELYNLKEDIGEKRNLACEMPGKVSKLHEMLRSWQKEMDAQMPRPNPDYDPDSARFHAGAW